MLSDYTNHREPRRTSRQASETTTRPRLELVHFCHQSCIFTRRSARGHRRSYNQTTKRLSREAGYQIGLAVKQQVYDPKKFDLFEIPRIELYNEPWLKTKLRIENVIGRVTQLILRR